MAALKRTSRTNRVRRTELSITLPEELFTKIDESANKNYRARTREIQRLLEFAFFTMEKELLDRHTDRVIEWQRLDNEYRKAFTNETTD